MLTAENQSDFCDATARGRGIQRLKQLLEANDLKLRGANSWHSFDFSETDETDRSDAFAPPRSVR